MADKQRKQKVKYTLYIIQKQLVYSYQANNNQANNVSSLMLT